MLTLISLPNKFPLWCAGNFVVGGLQLGNVWIGVQPALGVEGDPMRLLFERDLTPHPQYAAFYKWLQHDYAADAVLHFGMHGTVEWLPGAPLGKDSAILPRLQCCTPQTGRQNRLVT